MGNRSQLTIGLQNMNHYETDTNGALVNPAPLFASVWLALFHVLRKNYNERNLAEAEKTNSSRTTEQR
jgi:hypothetical protein